MSVEVSWRQLSANVVTPDFLCPSWATRHDDQPGTETVNRGRYNTSVAHTSVPHKLIKNPGAHCTGISIL